jgi:hypothetical protein
LHSFLYEFAVFYVEQVAFAVAVGATESAYQFASFADGFGDFALVSFVPFFIEHFDDFYCVAVK